MSFLKPRLIFNLHNRCLTFTPSVSAYWNKDWKPSKYPVTDEERCAAAKKYNLLPVEYEPVPDDGNGAGDYPGLEPYSVESRDPFYPWDYPEYRRDFGEAMHQDFNLYGQDRIYLPKRKFSILSQAFLYFGTLGIMYIGCYYGLQEDSSRMTPRHMPKHIPKPGVTHYTYE